MNLTRNDLIRRLRDCGSRDAEICESCPYADEDDCGGALMLDAAEALEDEADG